MSKAENIYMDIISILNSMNMKKYVVSVIGATGVFGAQVVKNLLRGDRKEKYQVLICKTTGQSFGKVGELEAVELDEAIPKSDFIILCVEDFEIKDYSNKIVPLMKPGATMILVDASAAYIGDLMMKDGCSFVMVHPCHPPLFGPPEEKGEDIVVCLIKGNESAFEEAKNVCIDMFESVKKVHRVTVEQMVLLEPAAAEIIFNPAALLIKRTIDKVISMGVPKETAESFLLGHALTGLKIVFGKDPHGWTRTADAAAKIGFDLIINKNWEKIFDREELKHLIRRIFEYARSS